MEYWQIKGGMFALKQGMEWNGMGCISMELDIHHHTGYVQRITVYVLVDENARIRTHDRLM